jgi:hypothetical protein
MAYYLALKMEGTCSSKTAVDFYISGDRTLHNYRCENLKSHMDVFFFSRSLSTARINPS